MIQKPIISKCLNCKKSLENTYHKNQLCCNTICYMIFKIKVEKILRKLKGISRRRMRWKLYHPQADRAIIKTWAKNNPRKMIASQLRWQSKNRDKANKNATNTYNRHKERILREQKTRRQINQVIRQDFLYINIIR